MDLLGSQDCVESLRKDLIDLQGTVLDVFSKTGAVRFPSWKFPDKLSCSLDLVNLLEMYDYAEGETERNQLSHVVLLELVIDRLLLLLQSFNTYTELTLGLQTVAHSGRTGPSVSIGPVVKRYWSSLVQFSSQQQQTRSGAECQQQTPEFSSSQADIRTSTPRSAFNPKAPPRLRNTPLHTPPSTLKHTAQPSPNSKSIPAPNRTAPPLAFKTQTCSVSCQTTEVGVPCESCTCVQASLKQSASAVVLLYKSLGLTCSLQHVMVAMEDAVSLGRLSAFNVTQWAEIQRTDMNRLGKHIMEVQGTAVTLKDRLMKTEEEREILKEQLKQEEETANREREERRRREEECERRVQEMKTRKEEEESRQQEEQKDLRRGVTTLEKKISELRAQLELHKDTQQSLECERDLLKKKVQSLQQQEVSWREEEERRRSLQTELRNTQALLDKERVMCQSSQLKNETLQVKQQDLLQRVSSLFKQCEDLQSRLQESDDKIAELTDTLRKNTQEKGVLQEQLTQQKFQCHTLSRERESQRVRVCELEETVSRLTEELQQAAERERLLVAFPEKLTSHRQTKPKRSGDVLSDMEQQMKANSIRIKLLEKENESLSISLAKLTHTQTQLLPVTQIQSRGDHAGLPDHRKAEGDGRNVAPAWKPKMHPSSSAPSHQLSAIHVQSLRLSLTPDAEETYKKIRQAARSSSAVMRRRRK